MVFSRLCISEKDEVTTVRQEIGPAVSLLFLIGLGCELRRATLCGDAIQPARSTKENHSLLAPRASCVFSNITQILRTPARSLDFEKFSVCEVAEGTTIR